MGYSLKNHHEICGNFINKAKKQDLYVWILQRIFREVLFSNESYKV